MTTKKAPTGGQGWKIEMDGDLSMPSVEAFVKGVAYATA